jgi:hypothetical protein
MAWRDVMHRYFVILALAVVCQSVMAEFDEFRKLDVATVYTDESSIARNGNTALLWIMIDYKSPQPDKSGKSVLSDKLQYQYDCKEKQYSIIASSAHAGNMATGETVSVNPDPPVLTPVEAGTMVEEFWKMACTQS